MAKTFLTNINLKGNQLLNAVIHSASSAPSALAAGQLYFNSGDNLFYYSTGTGTSHWEPVGVQYITSVGSNLSVTAGELNVNLSDYTPTSGLDSIITGYNYITASGQYIQSVGDNLSVDGTELKVSADPEFNTIHLTSDGQGDNILVGNDAYIGDINVPNFIGIKGNEDATKGGIKFGSAKTETISTDGSSLTLTADNDIVLLPGSDYAYLGTPLIDGSNRIATLGDINTDLNGYVTETGVETLTNKTIGDKLNFVGYTNPTDGYIWSNTNNGELEIYSEYDIQLSPSGIVNIGDGYGELHLQKTEYWRNGTQQGVIAAQSDNSLRLTATDGQLQLESNGGDVRINPSSTVTWFNNNLNINGDGGVISTDNNSLHLNADNGTVTTDTSEFHTTKVELWNGGDTSGSRLGIIVAHPSDGSLSIAASNQLVLEAHSGDIVLSPSTGIIDATSDNAEMHLRKTEYWNSGTQYGVITNNSNTFKQVATAGDFDIESNNGDINLTANNNVSIQTSNGDIVLNADGNSYINSVSDGNRIAKISDIHASTAGLSVKNSVSAASTDANIPLTGTYTTSFKIDNYPLETGDRVLLKNQSDATANGIYVVTITDASHYSLARAEDQLTPAEGDFTFVSDGDTWQKTGWILNEIDAGAITWTQFSAAGEYTQGAGITISANEISVDYTAVETQLVSDNFAKTSDIPSSSTIAGDITASSTYISDNAGIIDVNISALESQLVTDDFAKNADYSTVTRKFTGAITGNNADDTFTITHSLSTRDVIVRVYQTSGTPDTQWADVEVDFVRTTANVVTVSFAEAPATGTTYNCVVVG
jgi:uncharacterized protein (DUF2345 family)